MQSMALSQHEAMQAGVHGRVRLSKYNLGSARSSSEFPFHIILWSGKFLHLLSVYIVHRYLQVAGTSVVTFMFVSLLAATVTFLVLHPPWKGRPLSKSQLMPTVINGAILALSTVLWGQGLRACGPVRTVMAEYVGAVVGAVSTLIFGRGGGKWKKAGGLVAMLASYFFISQGWTMATYSPFTFRNDTAEGKSTHEENSVGILSMSFPIFAGILAALQRLIARRVSLKSQMKKRLHAVTLTAAACCLFPVAVLQAIQVKDVHRPKEHVSSFWAVFSNTVFGIIMIFYVDSLAEERLHVGVSSPKHLLVTSICVVMLEMLYKMDFSLLGFFICASLLGLGIFESTPLQKIRRDSTELPMQSGDITASNIHMSDISDSHNSLIMSATFDAGSEEH